jgi:hypothetical protein
MSDDKNPLDNVVVLAHFGKQIDVRDSYYDNSGRRHCLHHQPQLDTRTRTVRCSACRADMNAFDILLEYAHNERHWTSRQKQARELSERVKELEAEEQRIKARITAASRKEAGAALEEERARHEERNRLITKDASEMAAAAVRILRAVNGGKGRDARVTGILRDVMAAAALPAVEARELEAVLSDAVVVLERMVSLKRADKTLSYGSALFRARNEEQKRVPDYLERPLLAAAERLVAAEERRAKTKIYGGDAP